MLTSSMFGSSDPRLLFFLSSIFIAMARSAMSLASSTLSSCVTRAFHLTSLDLASRILALDKEAAASGALLFLDLTLGLIELLPLSLISGLLFGIK